MHVGLLALVLICSEPDPAELPRWTEAPAPAPRDVKVPRDGGGAIVLGSLMLVAGAGMLAGSIAMTAANEYGGAIGLGLGSAAVGGGGAGFLVTGVKTRRKFRATELGQVRGGPSTGRAMHAGASVALVVGSGALLIGILSWYRPISCTYCFEPPTEALLLPPIGAGLIVAGSAMLIVSQVNRTKYRKWLQQGAPAIQPKVSIGPTAIQIGLSGSF